MISRTVDRRTLEQHLWRAAELLRGQVHSTDYKQYLFSVLFLKRLSDRYDEEVEGLEHAGLSSADALGPDAPHEFFVPEGGHWSDLTKVETGIGESVNAVCRQIEDANPYLDSVLSVTDFADARLGNREQRDETLSRLLGHFSTLRLRNSDLESFDSLGGAYEYMVKSFAADSGRRGGEFYTPPEVVRLMVQLLDLNPDSTVYDPTCGSGGMLLEAGRQQHRANGGKRLFGQERLPATWAICRMNMLLHGLSGASIELGDTLRDPKHLERNELRRFDRVIANPPFSLSNWGATELQSDKYERFQFGGAPPSRGDWAFVQHMLASCKPTGRVAVVLPLGSLSRRGVEADIRAGVIRADLLEAVVGLGQNLFYGALIPASILVFSMAKRPERRGKVLFVDGSDLVSRGRSMNRLGEEHVTELARLAQSWTPTDGLSSVVDRAEIALREFDLSPTGYVNRRPERSGVSAAQAMNLLREASTRRAEALTALDAVVGESSWH